MFAQLVRTSQNGLAAWWYEHKEVPREAIVERMLEFSWVGLQRVAGGERLSGSGAHGAVRAQASTGTQGQTEPRPKSNGSPTTTKPFARVEATRAFGRRGQTDASPQTRPGRQPS